MNTPSTPPAPNPSQLLAAARVAQLAKLPAPITPTVERAVAQLLAARAIR
jgi:hypothetical protein